MSPLTKYRVDGADVLIDVDQGWIDFALSNGAPHLLPPKVLGRSLWEFLDVETQLIYRQLFRRVRTVGSVISLQLRCDSPRVRRHIALLLEPTADHGVALTCELISSHDIAYRSQTPVPVAALLRMCSWCNRVAVADEWLEVEQALPLTQTLEQFPLPLVTHGICPECVARLEPELGADARG